MDLSKLPKMGSTPPPPAAVPENDAATFGQPGPTSPLMMGDLTTELVIAGVLGLIFIMLGQNFGSWLLHGGHLDTGYTWQTGPKAGQPQLYFELFGGTAWLEMGEWVLGICLLLEAVICGFGLLRKHFGHAMGMACLLLGAIGAAANLLAIIMQMQAGYTQPIMSVIALAVGVVTALLHGRRVLT